ncbi:MAG: hypothetical protein J6J24_04965 [Clostridia bacterium]|nr:hypothetical protein [Clostridia bacterium]
MRIYSGENLEIKFDSALCECVEKAVLNFNFGIGRVQSLLGCSAQEIGKVKASFFTKREEFISYIKTKMAPCDELPPDWATGCFYGGESQILINPADEEDVSRRKYTLLHEAIHLYVQKAIYEKFDVERIVWFDEAIAGFLDKHSEKYTQQEWKNLAIKLKPVAKGFDMNKLNDFSIVKTSEYDGYDMFLLIGKFMIGTNLIKDFLETIKSNPDKIREEGLTILQKAVEYVEHI